MKKAIKILLLAITAIISTAEGLHGGPVRQREATYTQPDGSTFNVRIKGDEWVRIRTTVDGCTISKDDQGWWCYGTYDSEGHLVCSEYRVGSAVPADIISRSRNIPYDILNQKVTSRRAETNARNAEALNHIRKETARTKGQSTPTQKRGIAILAQFQDTKFTYSKEDFHNLLNQKGYKETGSARDYYESQFGENWEFIFDVSDIITLPNSVKHYGANKDGYDIRPAELIRDACKEADKVVDFSLYDQDGDKEVDNIYVFMAGHDEAEYTENTDLMWSHQWYILDGAGIRLSCDEVLINRYACSSELSGKTSLTGIGTFCHEYAHTFGLPDFYDTDYDEDGAYAAGLWFRTSLMDGGNYNNNGTTPPNLNCIERKLLGLSEPVPLESGRSYTLEPIHKNGLYHILPTKTEGEYFLFECRSNEGWDRHIGGSGMLVYHIDENETEFIKEYGEVSKWTHNTVNTNPEHQCVDLIEADQRTDNITNISYPYSDISGIFYPQSEIISISAKNTPAFKSWDGTKPDISIMGMARYGENIRFSVIEGEEIPEMPEVIDFDYKAFPDAIFISFKASGAILPDKAVIEWRKDGDTEFKTVSITSESSEYTYLITGLDADNTLYDIRIRFESIGLDGNTFRVQRMTKRKPEVTWPYFYLTDGSDVSRTYGFIAHVVNSAEAIRQEWRLDGQQLQPVQGRIFPGHSGRLSCILTWKDGSTDTIIKEIIINK